MTKFILRVLVVVAVTGLSLAAHAQDADGKSPAAPPAIPRVTKQANVASTNAAFGKIAKTDEVYKSALDAHALEEAFKMVGKDGAFKGTVTKVFEPRGVAIMNFDVNYRTALTSVVQATNFAKFPALTNLVGKEVVVTGKFIDYQGRAEVVLTEPAQVKVVEEAK